MNMAYSRRKTIEEKRNRKKALYFFFLTIVSIVLLFLYGLPAVIKYAAFFADLGKSSQPFEFEDSTPPPPPFIESLPTHTNDERIDLKGRTEPGATVRIHLNRKEEELIANNEGGFELSLELRNGTNTISVIAEDTSGNESQYSEILIIFDDEEPDIEITKPQDGDSYFGPKQRQLIIEGATESDAKLNINSRWVVVDSDGSFSYATTLDEGDNNFTISSEDEAGNISEKSLSVTYTP